MNVNLNILFFVFCFGFMTSQDVKQEIININKSYYMDTEIAVEVVSQAFINTDKKPISESKMTVYKKPGMYLYINGPSESMANNKYKVNVNHSRKLIIITKIINKAPVAKSSDAEVFNRKDYGLKLDTIMNFYKKVEVKSIDENTNELSFFLKEGAYDFIKITYNKSNYKVYDYFIKTKPEEVEGKKAQYSYYIKNNYISKKVSNGMFSESNYITIKNKIMVPIPKFANYKIVNNSNQKG